MEAVVENFDELVKQYEPMIYKVIQTLHIYKNKDEFYQTGLIALWEARNRYNPDLGPFSAIAYSYIRGRMMVAMRKSNRHHGHETTIEEETWNTIADPLGAEMFIQEDLGNLAKELSDTQRKWLMYTVLHNLSITEIAKIEHVSPSTVKLWRKGAREKLQGYREALKGVGC